MMATSKQRREAERRRLQRQMERRKVRDLRRRRTNLIISIVGTLVVVGGIIALIVGTGGDDTPSAGKTDAAASSSATIPSAPASSSAARVATYPCDWPKAGTASKKVAVPSTTTPPKTGKVTVDVKTNRGTMTVTLDRSLAPCTVASFVSLVNQKYYNATPCHRLTTSGIFVLQCGDPTGSGSGGPGYSIPDEGTGKETYPAGTIAMARTQTAHSGGSQFFIVYKDSPNLVQNLGQLQYTVFGKVTSGLDVVTKVAAGGATTGDDGAPKLPISLATVSVTK